MHARIDPRIRRQPVTPAWSCVEQQTRDATWQRAVEPSSELVEPAVQAESQLSVVPIDSCGGDDQEGACVIG